MNGPEGQERKVFAVLSAASTHQLLSVKNAAIITVQNIFHRTLTYCPKMTLNILVQMKVKPISVNKNVIYSTTIVVVRPRSGSLYVFMGTGRMMMRRQ